MTELILFAVAFLAFSNGANDNFKGVASLFGSETLSYRKSLWWGTGCTFAGSLAAIVLAEALLSRFSGKGLVPDSLAGSEPFLLAVALGAGLTVILATRLGFPISTTHSLTGAMVGSGWIAAGNQLNFAVLSKAFFLPLLLSPVTAVALGAALYFVMRGVRLLLGIGKEWCVCVGTQETIVPMPQPSSLLAAQAAVPEFRISADTQARCAQRYSGSYLGISVQRLVDGLHVLSAGLVSFARGLNDTPKMAALLMVSPLLSRESGMLLVAMAIATGGLSSARRVAHTMSQKISSLNHGQGLAANLATGVLVTAASLFGLPVSTTHVAVGSLVGIGLTSRQAHWRTIGQVLAAWLFTLPCAACLGALAYQSASL